MSLPRLAALGVAATLLSPFAHAELRPLGDHELSQVHAAGLPDLALQSIAAGRPLAAAELPMAQWAPWQESANMLERQQALAPVRLGLAVSQSSLGLMQLAALPALATPFAPLFLPALALPFPFFTLPPKKADGGG